MKKSLLCGFAVAAIVIAGSASAADIGAPPAYKVPPAVAPVVFSWTGCYVGGHVGYGWGRTNWIPTGADFSLEFDQTDVDTAGPVVGGQVGCDYQFAGRWVVGIQASFSGAHIDGTGFEQDVFSPAPDTVFESFYSKTDWIASVTGRLGFAPWSRQTLIYAKGGAAWAHDRYIFNEVETCNCIPDNGIQNATETRTGWTAGLGFEWAFAPNWSVWVEGNHYDFGTRTVAFSPNEALHAEFERIRQRIEVVTFGVNYRFNFGKAPVVARY